MKIELTAQEYLALLDLLHIADVVTSGHRREEDERTARHRAIIQRLYGLGRSEGLDRLMGYDESARRFVPTAAFEQESLAHTLLAEFGNHLFWDELISRLSQRDAVRQAGGQENLSAMSEKDRLEIEGPIRQGYMEEFARSGVMNLAVVERFDLGSSDAIKTSD